MEEMTVIVPVLNEAESLRALLPGWLEWCRAHASRLIVVDDGSRDGTPEVLAAHLGDERLSVFRHRHNRGYGNAIKTGLSHAKTAFAGTMDADGQHAIADLGRLMALAIEQHGDLIIGSRTGTASSGIYRNLGKALIRWIAKGLFGVTIQDLNSGMKVYRTHVAQALLPYCPGTMAFSDVITLTYLNLGYRVLEAPIEVVERRSGKSTINTMTAVDTVLEIVNVSMWFKPLKVFVPLAVVLATAGILWAIPFLLLGRGLSSISLLLLLAAMMVAVLGLLAEQMASSRRVGMPEVGAQEILVAQVPPADTDQG
jgi:glycosyltransferase involved in cell wall biosynthesis